MAALRAAAGWRASVVLSLRGFFQFPRKLLDSLTHNLASLKFHRRPRWNHETAAGLIRISTDARLCQPRLENAKVAQLDGDVVGQTVGDLIKRPLDYIEDLVLDHAGLVTDGDNDVAFG
jgi:hypothetical protein